MVVAIGLAKGGAATQIAVSGLERISFRASQGVRPMSSREDLNILGYALEDTRLWWNLCIVGEDQSYKLSTLLNALNADPSETGDGKKIESGYSYWGLIPTLKWKEACEDPLYHVMREGLKNFHIVWNEYIAITETLSFCHYVSLGVGTGGKDRHILSDLAKQSGNLYYFPVDMSPEMLRIGVRESLKGAGVPKRRVLPAQIDFSLEHNLLDLRDLVRSISGEDPVLYSLLGNTLANFEDDAELLLRLAGMLRDQDR